MIIGRLARRAVGRDRDRGDVGAGLALAGIRDCRNHGEDGQQPERTKEEGLGENAQLLKALVALLDRPDRVRNHKGKLAGVP